MPMNSQRNAGTRTTIPVMLAWLRELFWYIFIDLYGAFHCFEIRGTEGITSPS